MNPQRLIIVFLTLSGAAVLAAFLLSGSDPEPLIPGTLPLAAGPSSAFTEALPADLVPAERNDRNLTDKLARTFAEGLLINNPEGPRTVVKEDVLLAPSPEAYLEQFLSTPGTVTALTIAQAETISRGTAPGSVPVLEKTSEEERSAYLRKFTEIFDANLLVPEIQALLEESPSPEILNSVSGVLAQSAKRLDALRPPKEFLSLHIAARESLVRLDEIISLSPESSDPLKALLSLEENHRAVLAAAERLAAESKKLPKSISALPAGGGFFPTAHAVVVPVNDPAHTAVTWGKLGKMLADWAKDYFKEKLKDLVVNRLTRAMVGWVKGEGLSAGQPRFVTNWQRFMDDVVNEAGGSVIESVAPELCQSFGPLVRVAVEPIGARGPRFRTSCTLDRVVSNIQDFYDDFENGGWLAYGAAYQERNNYFGSLLAVNEEVMSAISKAKEAKRDETVAAGGYLGSVVCVKWGWKEAPGTTTSNGLPVLPRGNFECLERKTTTPGSTVGSVVNQALLAPLHRIVNADRLTELMNALVDSALYKLFNSFKNQWGDKGLLGVEVGNVTPGNPLKNCEGLSGDAYALCVDEMRKACLTLPPELQQECLDSIVEESVCNLGEKEMDSPNASGADPSGTEGWWCDNDSVMSSLPEPATVRFRCTSDGFAGITRNMQNCNVREDQGTLGWTFDEAGTPTDLDGNPVTFEVKLTCPDETYVDLPAGDWNVVAWTRNPSNAAIACAVGEGGILGGSCIGNDASSPPPIADDLGNVIWDDTDVSGWEETGTLSSVTVRGEEYCLDYDKTNTWPAVAPFPEWDAVIVGNPWIFAYRGGAWHGATTEWFGEGRTCKGTDTLNPSSNSIGFLKNFIPVPGEKYGFMVSAVARQTSSVRSVSERTNVLMKTWDGPAGICTSAAPPSGVGGGGAGISVSPSAPVPRSSFTPPPGAARTSIQKTDFLTVPDGRGGYLRTLTYAGEAVAKRNEIRQALRDRNYTQAYLALAWENGGVKFNFYEDPSGFQNRLAELSNAGLKPVVWLAPSDAPDFHGAYSPTRVKTSWERIIPAIDPLVDSYVLGRESDRYWTDSEMEELGRALDGLTGKPIFVHLSAGYSAGITANWWGLSKPWLKGVLYNFGTGFGQKTEAEVAARVKTIAPLFQAKSKYFIAGEYAAGVGESIAKGLGDAAVAAGADGFGNGGSAGSR